MPDAATLATQPSPLTWVFTGDSITQGVEHTHGARCWVEHVHERVRHQLGRVRDVVVNTGIAGWTAPQVLAEVDHLVVRFRPDVLSVALGMNDSLSGPDGLATFVSSLEEIIRRGAGADTLVVLHTPNTIGDGVWNEPADVARYAAAIRDVAAPYGAVVADHHARWSAAFPDQPPWPWLDNPVHPNAQGHWQMAQTALTALGLGELEAR